jgi:hypothetical protein
MLELSEDKQALVGVLYQYLDVQDEVQFAILAIARCFTAEEFDAILQGRP